MAFKVGSNAIDTDDVAEGANKYFTNARAEGVSINNLSEDSTPQLGGTLDVNGNEISSASNNNVVINPNGNGTIQLNATTTLEDGTHDFNIASHDGTNGLLLGGTLVTSSAAELNKLDGAGTIKQAGKETIWVPSTAMTPTASPTLTGVPLARSLP